MKSYQFPCGCTWPILEERTDPDVLPLLDFRIEDAPDHCPATWALLGRGQTKGVFQLESPLGRQWTKKLRPESAEHLSALGSILRPGCIRAFDSEGVSMTQHYCRRKNGEEEVKGYHPAIDPILFPTYNVMVYQEQAMAIAQAVAGFSLQEADVLRKAIGKKLPEEMAKCKKMFLDGASKAGILTTQQAEEVFGWIQESQRYSFNHSHAMCYGLTGYECAYIKAHFPLAFFTSWLDQAKNKQDPQQEIFELVNDAKLFDIYVEPPDIRSLEVGFHTDRKVIKFGIGNIKGVGDAQIKKLRSAVSSAEEGGKKLPEWSWYEFLIHCSGSITSSVVTRLIHVGALRHMGLTRQTMEAEFEAFSSLTKPEENWVKEHAGCFTCLTECLKSAARPRKEGGGCATKKRVAAIQSQITLLENPPTSRDDSPHWVAWVEEDLLGIALSCSRLDSCDLADVNVTCKEYLAGRTGFMLFGVEIQQVREVKTKKGKTPGAKMAFLTIADATCSVEDVVVFPDVWKEYGALLNEENAVILQAERDQRDEKSSTLIVKKVWQASLLSHR